MARKRRRARRSTKVVAQKCRKLRALTGGKFDKVKIGSRFYRAKGKAMDVDPRNSRVTVCPVGKSHKMLTSTGKLESLRKVAKRR